VDTLPKYGLGCISSACFTLVDGEPQTGETPILDGFLRHGREEISRLCAKKYFWRKRKKRAIVVSNRGPKAGSSRRTARREGRRP